VDISVHKEQVHAEVRYQAETIKEEINATAGTPYFHKEKQTMHRMPT